jgi:S-methylmethionine-dependent homocysteine/selenocysteine methylase
MMRDMVASSPRILAECAVAERLRRTPGITLHPTLFHTPLIYGPDEAKQAMASIYRQYIGIAKAHALPLLLCAPTWRLDASRLADANMPPTILRDAVDFIKTLRDETSADQPPIAIGALVGPRSDCYRPDLAPDAATAERFHRPQIEALAQTDTDFLLAQTLPSVDEAIGIARVMAQTDKPYVLSFCTGIDGKVLDGTPLPIAMERVDAACSHENRPLGYFVNCTHPRFLLSAYQPGELTRLIGIQANGSSRDVTQLDGAEKTFADPLADWTQSMRELHHQHEVPILGGCCGTDHLHLGALACAS